MRAQQKILPLKALAQHSAELRGAGKRLVLTNGCFDILHVGHVRYLEAARAFGDVLVVGVNSDASTCRLKGPTRPLVREEDRAEIIAALEAVDAVVVFDEDTAERLVEDVRPDVYVKGGDYSSVPDDPGFPVEGHVVLEYGGGVRTVPFVSGRSTSALAERLRVEGA